MFKNRFIFILALVIIVMIITEVRGRRKIDLVPKADTASRGEVNPTAQDQEFLKPDDDPALLMHLSGNQKPEVSFEYTHSPSEWPKTDVVVANDFCDLSLSKRSWRDLAKNFLSSFKLKTLIENQHLKFGNGEERRIQKRLTENGNFEHRFFTLDREGLPELYVPVAAEGDSDQLAEKWLKKTKQEHLLLTQQGDSEDGSAQVRVELLDGELQQIEFTSSQMVFSCFETYCRCQ